MKRSSFLFLALMLFGAVRVFAQTYLPGFTLGPYAREQALTINYYPEVRIVINAPSPESFNPANPTAVALFALPNGNTIEQTHGKILKAGDDWHFDIQHIGAQTRFLRAGNPAVNHVVVYLETAQKSWPSWRSKYANNAAIIGKIVDTIRTMFAPYNASLVLTGHSGGGSFTFGYMNGVTSIANDIARISFLDSDYNYDDATYGGKLVNWINASPNHYLSVIAYNDSVALLNGQPVVSPTGGTWYRSKMMAAYLGQYFPITTTVDTNFITYNGLNRRICFYLKQNPLRAILHTVQVEKNGHIQGMVSGTPKEGVGYTYYGARAYTQYVQPALPAWLTIPPRQPNARTGSQFMAEVTNMTFANREAAIQQELSNGNIPDFMRVLKKHTAVFQDALGASHTVIYEVMPDYLCIGSNADFCRIPMGPITAQKIANIYGASLPTTKLVDDIYTKCQIKVAPVTYTPVGNQNELVPKFIEHNTAIEQQRLASGQPLGNSMGGTKKDVVISNLITDPARPNRVCIYGWHQLSGTPIQPLTNIHIDTYVDYSHGVRFLNAEMLIDSSVVNIRNVLMSPSQYKILSNESGVMTQPSYIKDTSLPAQIKSFGVVPVDTGTIRIVLQPDARAQQYTAYYSMNTALFTDSAVLAPSNLVISGLKKNTIYYVKLKASNSLGSSALSEVLCAKTDGSGYFSSLIVLGFDRATAGNTFDYVKYHAPGLNYAGARISSCTNDAVTDGLFSLNDYKFVDYVLGDESTVNETFSTAEQAIVSAYLKANGNLFVSGAEIAWDLDYKGSAADKDFCYNYLKMQYVADAPNNAPGTVYQANGLINPFNGLGPILYDNGTHGTINVQYPDVIKPLNGSTAAIGYETVLPSTGVAGIYYQGAFPPGIWGGVFVMGFPFESVYGNNREALMARIVHTFIPITAAEEPTGTPYSFSLSQNYPNPFNPTTTIQYQVPSVELNGTSPFYPSPLQGEGIARPAGGLRVRLTVYDILGNLVASLVNEEQSAGNYSVDFKAANLPSGVYYYRLTAGAFSATKKMILLR